MQEKFWNTIIVFSVTFISVLLLREYTYYQLWVEGITAYEVHTIVGIVANVLIVVISYLLIKRNNLFVISGLTKAKVERWYLLLFPLFFLVFLNLLLADDASENILVTNIILFSIYCLSIGFAEELSIRGFLQSYFIKRFGRSKRGAIISVLVASLFFGVIHLIKFDSGVYGEMAQLLYATFIGLMFGILLLVTKNIYPLIIVHALVDFSADFGEAGMPVLQEVVNPASLENAILIVLLTSPCLIYALVLMARYKYIEVK